jgi:hypothetical protein
MRERWVDQRKGGKKKKKKREQVKVGEIGRGCTLDDAG